MLLFVAVLIMLLQNSVTNLTRLNETGDLYYCEYQKDYTKNLAVFPFLVIKSSGCTGFLTHLENGDVVTARHYVLAHLDMKDEITGLNVIIKLTPEGKYASINGSDASWLNEVFLPYNEGFLGEGNSWLRNIPLGFLPYLCMDGINEKGLSCSIMAVDIKKGEHAESQRIKGKRRISINMLLREILDNCKDIDEAIEKTKEYNICGILDNNYHLFLTDETGRAVTLEWRYDTLTIAECNIATNFFLTYDDAEDLYKEGYLKERYYPDVPRSIEYHYGYGHGFARFRLVADEVEKAKVPGTYDDTVMSEDLILSIMERTRQVFDGTPVGSHTQYSVLYNNSERTATYYVRGDGYQIPYAFSF